MLSICRVITARELTKSSTGCYVRQSPDMTKCDHKQAWQTAQRALQAARNAETLARESARTKPPSTPLEKIEATIGHPVTAIVLALLAFGAGISGAPNHTMTLVFFGAAWLASMLLLRKLRLPYFLFGAVVAAVVVVALAGLFQQSVAESDTHGWLESAGEAFPSREDSACDAKDLESTRPNGMLFSLGKPGMWFSKKPDGKRPLLTVGRCTLMFGEFRKDQFLFSADVFDDDHQLVARIDRNEFHLVPGKYAYQTRPDKSTLNVYDKAGKLLLSVHRRNKDAMLVTGDFKCSDGKEAKVEADGQLTMIGPKAGSLGVTNAWSIPAVL